MDLVLCRGDACEDTKSALEKETPWIELGEELLVLGTGRQLESAIVRAGRSGMRVESVVREVDRNNLYMVFQKGRLFQQEFPDVPVLVDRGRFLVVQMSRLDAERHAAPIEPCFVIKPVEDNTAIFNVRRPPAARRAPVGWVQALITSVQRTPYEANLTQLVSYPTRHSTSSHYADVANWARDQLNTLGYDARVQTIAVQSQVSYNVVADKPGAGSGTRGIVFVVGHLDSVNIAGGPSDVAPGADDNGSGSAGVLEIARVLKDHPATHDLRLVLFGGEEQGLHGSTQYVTALSAAERSRIRAVINMDMIGTLNTATPTVLLEGAAISQSLIDDLADAAQTYTSLIVQTSLNPFASDHVPFINASLPAVLTIEGADGANGNIHSANDLMAHIDHDLALEILRMNVAATATALSDS